MSSWSPQLSVSAAVLLAAAAAAAYLRRRRRSFTVLSWNVLAREFTAYNREPPGCVQGHQNQNAAADGLESREQTAARYGLAGEALLREAPDAVLLQELSTDFFDSRANPLAEALLRRFQVAHQTNGAGPGTAVLVRKAGPLAVTGVVRSVGASEERTGGTSKSASAALVSVSGAACWLVSVHLAPHKYRPEAVRTHLALMSEAFAADADASGRAGPLPRMVLGGDLNAEPHEVAQLQRELPFLGTMLARVPPPGHTGLTADFSQPVTIDHMFVSAGLRLLGVGIERAPSSPYGKAAAGSTAPVVAASDHVWQSIRLSVD